MARIPDPQTFTYDAVDRILSAVYGANLNSSHVTYAWDTQRVGNLTSVDNTTSKTGSEYFPMGLVKKTTQTTGTSLADAVSVMSFEYNRAAF